MICGSLVNVLNESVSKPTIKDRVQGAAKGAIKYAVPGAMAGTVLGTGTWNAFGILGGSAVGLAYGATGGAVHGFINPNYHKEFIDKDLKSFANHPIDYVAKNPGKVLAGAGGALVGTATVAPGSLMFGRHVAPAVIGAGAVGGSRLFSKLYDKPRNKSLIPMAVGAGIGGITGGALGTLACIPSSPHPILIGAGAATGAAAGAYLGSRNWFDKDKKKVKKLKEQAALNLYNYIDEAVDLLVDTAVIYFLETFDNSLLYCLANGIYEPILEEAETNQQPQQGNPVSDNTKSTTEKVQGVINNAKDSLSKNSDNKGFIDKIISKLKEWFDKLTSKSNESKSEGKTADANKLDAAKNAVQATINQAENKADVAEKKEEKKPLKYYDKKTNEVLGFVGGYDDHLYKDNPDVEVREGANWRSLNEAITRDQSQLFIDLAKENSKGAYIRYPTFNDNNSLTRDEVHKDYRILHHLNNEKRANPINNQYLRQFNAQFNKDARDRDQKDLSTLEKLFALVKNAVYKGRDFIANLIDAFYVWLQKIQDKINERKNQGEKGIWLTIKDKVVSAIRWLTTKLHNFIQKDRGDIYNEYNKLNLSDDERDIYTRNKLTYDAVSLSNNINIAFDQTMNNMF